MLKTIGIHEGKIKIQIYGTVVGLRRSLRQNAFLHWWGCISLTHSCTSICLVCSLWHSLMLKVHHPFISGTIFLVSSLRGKCGFYFFTEFAILSSIVRYLTKSCSRWQAPSGHSCFPVNLSRPHCIWHWTL